MFDCRLRNLLAVLFSLSRDVVPKQWRTQKVSEGAKVLSQSCDVTNQLYGECRRHNHSGVVRGHAPEKFCKITPKNTHFGAFWKQVLV